MRLKVYKVIKFVKSAWTEYEYKIILVIGFLLVAGISFEFGLIQGKKGNNSPLIIEKAAQAQEAVCQAPPGTASQTQNLPQEAQKTANNANIPLKDCTYVGSKNSDKYYPPTCSYAKKIKPENLVCFKTEGEAINQGRIRSTGCKNSS